MRRKSAASKSAILTKIKITCLVILTLVDSAWGYCHYRFWQLSRGIEKLSGSGSSDLPFLDLKGAIHVHTAAGGHSRGTLDEVVDAARQKSVDFVIITEHPRPHGYLARYQSEPGKRPILIFGEEREEQVGRALVVPYPARSEELRIATHWMSVPQEAVAEIINLHEEADGVSRLRSGCFLLGSLPGYSRYFLFPIQRIFRNKLHQWDYILKQRPLWVVGGNDAHANIGLRLEYSSGSPLLDWTVDPYAASFNYVSTHVQLPRSSETSPDAILTALAKGFAYVSFDFLHDPKGFSFSATQPWTRRIRAGAELTVKSPVAARIQLLRDGDRAREVALGQELRFTAADPGVYRAELYLPQLGGWADENPWIISNPIFVVK